MNERFECGVPSSAPLNVLLGPCLAPGCEGTLAFDSMRVHLDGSRRVYHKCSRDCGMSTMFKVKA